MAGQIDAGNVAVSKVDTLDITGTEFSCNGRMYMGENLSLAFVFTAKQSANRCRKYPLSKVARNNKNIFCFPVRQIIRVMNARSCSVLFSTLRYDAISIFGIQMGDLFEALGQSMQVGRDEIIRFQVR